MLAAIVVAVLLTGAITPAHAIRSDEITNGAETYNATSGGLQCADFCVKCGDGTAIWYGRSRNWAKMLLQELDGEKVGHVVGGAFMIGVLGALFAGLTAASGAVLVPALLTGAAWGGGIGGGIMMAAGLADGGYNETRTHWSGAIPTTGMLCERTDVFKMREGNVSCLMRTKETRNALKPYTTDPDVVSEARSIDGFIDDDLDSYKEGCKVVNGAGVRGLKQLLPGAVSKAILKCSLHSQLCGPGGNPEIVSVDSAEACNALTSPAEGSK